MATRSRRCAEHGPAPDDAMAVWAAVSAMAIGSVTEAHRERLQAESGQPYWLPDLQTHRQTSRVRLSRRCVDHRAVRRWAMTWFGEDSFQQRMT